VRESVCVVERGIECEKENCQPSMMVMLQGREGECERERKSDRKRVVERGRECERDTCQPSMMGMLQSMSTRSYFTALVIVTCRGGGGVT
jgi:hypothetical protein